METYSGDLTGKNRELCEPCEEKGSQRPALFWCCHCPELLCKSCCDHHKVQKATRDHKSLDIHSYRKIGANIADLDMRCRNCDEELEFICLTHNQPCCLTCKRKLHGEGCHVKAKDEVLQKSDLQEKLSTTLKTIYKLGIDFDNSLSIQTKNICGLEEQRQMFYEELRSGREKVDDFLDDFEESVKRKFENTFASTEQGIKQNIRILEKTRNNIIHRMETVKEILELDNFPELKMFLLNNKFQSENADDQTHINSVSEQANNISPKPVFEIDKESKVITLLESLEDKTKKQSQYKSKPGCSSPNVQTDVEDFDISSSTVEAEEELEKSLSTAASGKDIGTVKDNGTALYKLKKHFLVERRNKDISINCAKFLKDNEIVMTERSENRILFYYTDGKKIGQIMVDDSPDEIAVLNCTKVVVSFNNTVVLIDTNKMKVQRERTFRDSVRGIAYANGQIYVCLLHKGMNVLDISGNILRYIPCIRGNLYVCATLSGCIFSAKRMSELNRYIFCFNDENNAQDQYCLDDRLGINGMASDKDNNVYLATVSPTIIKLDHTTKEFCTILSTDDGLNRPYNVDYCKDSDQLLIIDQGKEIKIFQK